jgi:hypothetical protein
MGTMVKVGRNEPCLCGSSKKYKRCCGFNGGPPRTPTNKEIRVRAFTDETGNSGNHLFDSNQPYFWTGTLVCEIDVDNEGKSVHAECLKRTEMAELHGSALGLSRIEKIAHLLRDFFLKYRCVCFFTRVEKARLAAMKLFDTLVDSGINKAVSNVHYGIRVFHMSLTIQLIQFMDDVDRRDFWEAYTTGNPAGFQSVLKRMLHRLIILHENGVYADRTVELLRDALEWGIANPKPLIGDGVQPDSTAGKTSFQLSSVFPTWTNTVVNGTQTCN